MDYNDRPQRPMFSGNWTCSGCGGAITELPFEPDPARAGTLKCRDCHRNSRPERSGGGGGDRPRRPMVQGNWSCSECGGAITELPFQPRPGGETTLKCRDCFRK